MSYSVDLNNCILLPNIIVVILINLIVTNQILLNICILASKQACKIQIFVILGSLKGMK